jgi:hypothetical protein
LIPIEVSAVGCEHIRHHADQPFEEGISQVKTGRQCGGDQSGDADAEPRARTLRKFLVAEPLIEFSEEHCAQMWARLASVVPRTSRLA